MLDAMGTRAKQTLTPLGAILRGAVAGTVGTLAMDAVWYARYRRGGGDKDPLAWEFGLDVQSWEQAPAPAQLGRRLFEAFTKRQVPVSRAALVNNVMHWGYGVAWGAQFGVLAGTLRRLPRTALPALGLPFGATIWGSSYVTLPLAGLYKPIWEYDADVLAKDLAAHLAYGLGTAAGFALLAPRD
jgi:hypothetical protein